MIPHIDRPSWRRMAIAVLAFLSATSLASAQPTGTEIRDLLGGPVNLEQVAVFAATRTTYKQFCGGFPTEEERANGINRLNYGSLEPDEQAEFKRVMQTQQLSNAQLLESLSAEGKASFCQGLDKSVTRTVLSFVQAHPELFETIRPDHSSYLIDMKSAERFRYSAVLMEGLFVGTLRMNDPLFQADIDQLRAESKDARSFAWRLTRFDTLSMGMRWQLNKLEVELGHMDDPSGCYGPDHDSWLQAGGCI